MLPIVSALVLAAAGQPAWDYLGTTASGLRLFIDRRSIADDGGVLHVSIRLGSPQTIVRNIVKIVQDEEVDCSGNRWRLMGYQAFDESDRIVEQRPSVPPPMGSLTIGDGTVGATVRDAICPAHTPQAAGGGSSLHAR